MPRPLFWQFKNFEFFSKIFHIGERVGGGNRICPPNLYSQFNSPYLPNISIFGRFGRLGFFFQPDRSQMCVAGRRPASKRRGWPKASQKNTWLAAEQPEMAGWPEKNLAGGEATGKRRFRAARKHVAGRRPASKTRGWPKASHQNTWLLFLLFFSKPYQPPKHVAKIWLKKKKPTPTHIFFLPQLEVVEVPSPDLR